ncbi:hypothetical protein M5D96_009246, partial [Drosophila gunungcola]
TSREVETRDQRPEDRVISPIPNINQVTQFRADTAAAASENHFLSGHQVLAGAFNIDPVPFAIKRKFNFEFIKIQNAEHQQTRR